MRLLLDKRQFRELRYEDLSPVHHVISHPPKWSVESLEWMPLYIPSQLMSQNHRQMLLKRKLQLEKID